MEVCLWYFLYRHHQHLVYVTSQNLKSSMICLLQLKYFCMPNLDEQFQDWQDIPRLVSVLKITGTFNLTFLISYIILKPYHS